MAGIFISYRRHDSGVATGRVYDRLVQDFGRDWVFMDIDDIPLGVDFRDELDRQIRGSTLMLAVIGPDWLKRQGGQRRLDAPGDYVRTEIEIALARGIPLIPVLLEGVAMPREDDLPNSIKPLAYRNAAVVHAAGTHFRGDMDRLIRGIQWLFDNAESHLRTQLTAATAPVNLASAQQTPGPPPVLSPPDPPIPETQRLLAEIADPATESERRLAIGDRLAELGDPRPGVGLRPDGLPDIAWVEILAGEFLYGENKERRHNDTFLIARYPVTNAQYQAFIADGGYREKLWWQGLGKQIDQPAARGWPQPNNRPRRNVAWCEAMAYCAWLSKRLGLAIRLPTEWEWEWEWERAARGTDRGAASRSLDEAQGHPGFAPMPLS